MVAVVRRPSECATRCTSSQSSLVHFRRAILRANFVVENFRAAAGNGLQTGVHQALDGFADAEFADFRDAQNFRRGKTVQVHLRDSAP